jgi:hypothetical protein
MYKEELIRLLLDTEGDQVMVKGRVLDEYIDVGGVRTLEDGSILIETT